MTTVKDIADYFETLIPREMKLEFDNVGLLVGLHNACVNRVVIALDITEEVINEAINVGAQMIVSHHPAFFDLKFVTDSDINGQKVIKLLQNGISCLCMHTNLDQVTGGVNDALAKTLRVQVEGYLSETRTTSDGKTYGTGRYGQRENPCEMVDFLSFVKSALQTNGLRYHDAGRPVSKVALCGGSGGEFVTAAAALGCDTLVTADIKYHEFLNAKALGINLIDGDHFCTENVVVPILADLLRKNYPEVDIIISKRHAQTAQFF